MSQPQLPLPVSYGALLTELKSRIHGAQYAALRAVNKFYRAYQAHPNLQPLAGEIAWTKHTLILDRCAEPLQREFYLRATARFGWTRKCLIKTPFSLLSKNAY